MRRTIRFAATIAALVVISCIAAAPATAQTSLAPGGIYGGMGAYFIKPTWTTNPAVGVDVGAVTAQIDFDYDMSIAPLIWIGASNCESGLGMQARAWSYEDDAGFAAVNPGITLDSAGPLGLQNLSTTPGDLVGYGSSLEMDVIDAVGTWTHRLSRADVRLGAGLRLARVDQQYLHVEIPVAPVEVDAVFSRQQFEGFGPTISMENRVPLLGGLSFLADFRYSTLLGDSQQDVIEIVNNAFDAAATQRNESSLNIFEMELGGEVARQVGRFQVFGQGAYVTQFWQGTGNSSNNDVITVVVDPEISDKNANLTMHGFRATAGVRF